MWIVIVIRYVLNPASLSIFRLQNFVVRRVHVNELSFRCGGMSNSNLLRRNSFWPMRKQSEDIGQDRRPLLSHFRYRYNRNFYRYHHRPFPSATLMKRLGLLLPLFLLLATTTTHVHAFAVRGGGRPANSMDKIDRVVLDDADMGSSSAIKPLWFQRPLGDHECRLIVCQITDVYTLEHLASFKTLVEQTRARCPGAKIVSMLTGDFLSPYLLSGVDKGVGMMNALNSIPLDYLTWGNHEADISHKTVCRHVRNFRGTWINSNMLDHEAMDAQQAYDVIQLTSADGSQTRKVGLTAVLSNDPALYAHFKKPGAFGGATITNPWEALKKYERILKEEEGCDVVLPLQHLYVPDDYKTCREFDFPVILSGHDHHKVDEVVDGTRLIKPGMNAEFATVLEFSWQDASCTAPAIQSQFAQCDRFVPDPVLHEQNERAYDVLLPLKNTELTRVSAAFEPLSSNGARESVCTVGMYICTLLRSSLNIMRRQVDHTVDAVLLMGGNIRGNADYPQGSYFSLEALEAEIKSDEVIGIVEMPGWLLAHGIWETHSGDPIPGWMQYDQGVIQDENKIVTHVAGLPIDSLRMYRVATKISDLTNGQCPSWTEYFTAHPEELPPKGAYVNIQSELMGYFARNLWRKIWDATAEFDELCGLEGCDALSRLQALDEDGDGVITVDEIQHALRDMLGFSVDDRETTLAQLVHSHADTTGNGRVTLADLESFCEEMEDLYGRNNGRLLGNKTSPSSAAPASRPSVAT